MSKSKFKRLFVKWHRGVGICSALFVVLLSLTGIALNHSDSMALGKRQIAPWLSRLSYGVEPEPVYRAEFELGSKSFSLFAKSGLVYLQESPLLECERFLGVSALGDNYIVACEERLIWLNADHQVIDQFDLFSGLPDRMKSLGVLEERICVSAVDAQLYCLDEGFNLSDLQADTANEEGAHYVVSPVNPVPQSEVPSSLVSKTISTERFLLDLHAGRFLGRIGPLFMDLVAILFLVSAISGLYLWLKKRKSR